MIYRLICIPIDTLDYNNELNIIYNIALNNGYNILTINKIYNKINRKIGISHLLLLRGFPTLFRGQIR